MTKVLVVDDSALMRRLLGGLLTEAGFEVALARNGLEGVERLTEWQPDVVTLDINMPEMDGLTALSMMMQARPTPVVMVSSLTERGAQATFEALALGAVDFIAKPGGTISLSVVDIADQLIAKVRAAARARPQRVRRAVAAPSAEKPVAATRSSSGRTAGIIIPDGAGAPQRRPPGAAVAGARMGVVLIGISTGGPRTLEEILPALPADFAWPVLVAQHMPANFTDAFARRMDRLCKLQVQEANVPMVLEPGNVYIGRGGNDMVLLERLGRLVVQPRPESAEHLWHPSVQMLVESAMSVLPAERVIGVMMTGMGNDGAHAMSALHSKGGRTIAESEETAIVFGMPHELIELGGASLVLRCDDVARQLCHWVPRTR